MSEALSTRRLVIRLCLVVVAMFGFGFALVPIYDVMCQAFGINGKTAGAYQAGSQTVMKIVRCGCSFSPPMLPKWSGSSALRRMKWWCIRATARKCCLLLTTPLTSR